MPPLFFFVLFWNHSSVTQTIDSSILIMTVNTHSYNVTNKPFILASH